MPRSHIGVTTEVSVQSSPVNSSVPSGRFQVAGISVKGPLNSPTIIRSITQYQQIFGARAPYETLYDTIRTFFQEGGAEVVVTRVVGPAATNGSVTLVSGDETPVDSVSVEITDPGAHSSDYVAVITHNTDAAATFNLQILDSATNRVIAYFQRAESPSDLVSLAMGNDYVIIRALGQVKPAAGTFNLSAGTDDREGITAATFGEALDAHKGVISGVAVAIPGQDPRIIAPVLGEHCANTGKIGLLEVPAGMPFEEALTVGDDLLGKTPYGSYLSMPLFPAIRVPDGSDRTRTVGPAGYVAAHRSVTHRQYSFAAAVAGPRTKTLWNFAPVLRLSSEDVNTANQRGINAIQSNTGVPYLNNWSSLSDEPGLYDLNIQDCLNNLTVQLKAGLQELIWRPNDGRDILTSAARAVVDTVMAPLVEGGWLYPTQDGDGSYRDAGYSVTVEDIRNSGQGAPYDSMVVSVGVKLSPTLRHIHVPIRKVDLRQGL